jgi:hypothetical protein
MQLLTNQLNCAAIAAADVAILAAASKSLRLHSLRYKVAKPLPFSCLLTPFHHGSTKFPPTSIWPTSLSLLPSTWWPPSSSHPVP